MQQHISPDLVIMACSAAKKPSPEPAIELYTGVMYSTFRAHANPVVRPHVAILSAQHGVIAGDQLLQPYDQKLTPARAREMLASLPEYVQFSTPLDAKNVLLAGGQEYRLIMRAALPLLMATGVIAPSATITETSGGIGYQRQQLGQFLQLCARREVIGNHPNGTLLFQALNGFTLGQRVAIHYEALPGKPAEPALIDQLFYGPSGPTACVQVLREPVKKPLQRWVALKHMKPAY